MLLVNLESLSTSELRNLAQQESIEDYSEMDRDDLIQSLTDKYEDENPNLDSEDMDIAKTVNVKNINSFSDNAGHSEYISDLPGMESLPDEYEETGIHFLYKNSDWGYVFWSVSSLDMEKIEEEKGSLILVVTFTGRDGKRESYDILISAEDRSWNIGFSHDAVSAFVSLVVERPDGKRDYLVHSNTITLNRSYWLEHQKEMKANDSLFKVYLALITTKTGEILSNPVVQEIVKKYREEDEK